MEYSINSYIARITVIEVPIIEDPLYFSTDEFDHEKYNFKKKDPWYLFLRPILSSHALKYHLEL